MKTTISPAQRHGPPILHHRLDRDGGRLQEGDVRPVQQHRDGDSGNGEGGRGQDETKARADDQEGQQLVTLQQGQRQLRERGREAQAEEQGEEQPADLVQNMCSTSSTTPIMAICVGFRRKPDRASAKVMCSPSSARRLASEPRRQQGGQDEEAGRGRQDAQAVPISNISQAKIQPSSVSMAP